MTPQSSGSSTTQSSDSASISAVAEACVEKNNVLELLSICLVSAGPMRRSVMSAVIISLEAPKGWGILIREPVCFASRPDAGTLLGPTVFGSWPRILSSRF